MPILPRHWRGHRLLEADVDNPEPGPGDQRRRLVGGPAGLDHDPRQIVRHVHQRVHNSRQMQGLESPDISRCHSDDRPGGFDPVLDPLLPLDRFDDPVGFHDLDWVRVGPGPDQDAVAADDDSGSG